MQKDWQISRKIPGENIHKNVQKRRKNYSKNATKSATKTTSKYKENPIVFLAFFASCESPLLVPTGSLCLI